MNNFTYMDFYKFGIESELKSREGYRCLIWMKFDEFDWTSRIDAIWTGSSWLHLDDNQLIKRNLEIQIHVLLAWFQEFDLNRFEFWGWLRIVLTTWLRSNEDG
jgi:hypothetical protein